MLFLFNRLHYVSDVCKWIVVAIAAAFFFIFLVFVSSSHFCFHHTHSFLVWFCLFSSVVDCCWQLVRYLHFYALAIHQLIDCFFFSSCPHMMDSTSFFVLYRFHSLYHFGFLLLSRCFPNISCGLTNFSSAVVSFFFFFFCPSYCLSVYVVLVIFCPLIVGKRDWHEYEG